MQQKSRWRYLIMLCWALIPLNSVAATPPEIKYDNSPLDLEILKDPDSAFSNAKIITADTIENFSAFRGTMPSLWWIQDQLPNKLVLNWLAYPDKKRIDLVVNPQFWNNLEYIERYQLINRYGLVARSYGYNVRIFDLKYSEAKPIVAYSCAHGIAPLRCNIQWQENGQRSIKVKSVR